MSTGYDKRRVRRQSSDKKEAFKEAGVPKRKKHGKFVLEGLVLVTSVIASFFLARTEAPAFFKLIVILFTIDLLILVVASALLRRTGKELDQQFTNEDLWTIVPVIFILPVLIFVIVGGFEVAGNMNLGARLILTVVYWILIYFMFMLIYQLVMKIIPAMKSTKKIKEEHK